MIPGDTKAGTLVGVDKFGNKYFENMQDELPRQSFLGSTDKTQCRLLTSDPQCAQDG